jgi:hypothetical protein
MHGDFQECTLPTPYNEGQIYFTVSVPASEDDTHARSVIKQSLQFLYVHIERLQKSTH